MRRIHLVVSGHVQGVGFRRFVQRAAREEAVAGWVCNRQDGSVELEAEGDAEALRSLREVVRRGPPGARVHDVVESDVPSAEPLPLPFSIRRD